MSTYRGQPEQAEADLATDLLRDARAEIQSALDYIRMVINATDSDRLWKEGNIAAKDCVAALARLDGALDAEIERLDQDLINAAQRNIDLVENERLRAALTFYAEGKWADGYPGGVFVDDNTLDFGETARAALKQRE